MNTPICDFVRRYSNSGVMRLHMPGHKGEGKIEKYDITEINGADSLYEAEGIIAQSEKNASKLFGCPTFYSTEGSSQCIRAMLYLASMYAMENGKKPVVLAGRNAHKTFLSAAALINFEIEWLYPEETESYLSCTVSAERLEEALSKADGSITAVYITSPDYLGNIADVKSLSEVCHKYGALLLVDNAHGAYLRFLPDSLHPIDMGADICCDSAHKTLPVLTGGAYLHITDERMCQYAKNALALFGSTSPSYLILQSLDNANKYISENYKEKITQLSKRIKSMKERLSSIGYCFVGNEHTKLTLSVKSYGYNGIEFADILRSNGIECEFADPDFVVLMFAPENIGDIARITEVLWQIPPKDPIDQPPPGFIIPQKVIGVREAMFQPWETVDVDECIGRVLAASTVGCPPAVPIVVCGERIDRECIACFKYYGIEQCVVLKEKSPF